MATNSSQNFFYTPDVTVVIGNDNGVQDVSSDLIDFTLTRQVNAVSTFSCTLNNPNKKYNYDGTNAIKTMDRITVFLKRIKSVQVFTGFVTYAPLETIVPVPITVQAQCTLRILQVTYWDDTLVSFQNLLLNFMDTVAQSSNKTLNDGGVAQAIVNLLYKVVGWNPSAIHIQSIPNTFVDFMSRCYSTLLSSNGLNQNVFASISKAIGAAGVTSGQSVTTGTNVTNNQAPATGGTDFNVSQAKAFVTKTILPGANDKNKPGSNPLNPVNINQINSTTGDTKGIFYCSLPWSYLKTPNMPASGVSAAKQFISYNHVNNSYDGRLLLVQNFEADKAVVLRATSVPQQIDGTKNGQAVYDPTVDYAQIHPGVLAFLNGKTGDPTAWTGTTTPSPANVRISWADQTKVSVGILKDFSTTLINSQSQTTADSSTNATVIEGGVTNVITLMRGQIGDAYTENNDSSKGPTRENPGAYGKGTGSFDCSGLVQWAYKTGANIQLGINTWDQCGPVRITSASGLNKTWTGYQNDKYGQWIGNTKQPQPGDLLFWDFSAAEGGDGAPSPQHVTMMTVAFGDPDPGYISSGTKGDTKRSSAPGEPGVGYAIGAPSSGRTVNEGPIYWNKIAGGKDRGYGTYLGARRPISLSQQAGIDPQSNPSDITTTTQSLDPKIATTRAINALTDAYSNLFQVPAFDPRASVLVGTPRAFLLDNPVMSDLTQIMSAGMRMYQSAPNGDFVAWFPDYYGVYGTDPVLEISPVEIINFNVYHNDDQLTTHVGVVGDTTGIGQQVSEADFFTTNGLVSVQDTTTMKLLFNNLPIAGSNAIDSGPMQTESTTQFLNNLGTVDQFLNIYGLRPQVIQQSMIHSQMMEYFLALQTFMLDWVNQFASTVQTTFLPELYPGMRIVVNIPNQKGTTDKYEFYVMSVTHQGSRSGGFTTQFDVTAPKKNNNIMHYGLNIT